MQSRSPVRPWPCAHAPYPVRGNKRSESVYGKVIRTQYNPRNKMKEILFTEGSRTTITFPRGMVELMNDTIFIQKEIVLGDKPITKAIKVREFLELLGFPDCLHTNDFWNKI